VKKRFDENLMTDYGCVVFSDDQKIFKIGEKSHSTLPSGMCAVAQELKSFEITVA
jgi:hypothetical protein